jgi:hypothetical protein
VKFKFGMMRKAETNVDDNERSSKRPLLQLLPHFEFEQFNVSNAAASHPISPPITREPRAGVLTRSTSAHSIDQRNPTFPVMSHSDAVEQIEIGLIAFAKANKSAWFSPSFWRWGMCSDASVARETRHSLPLGMSVVPATAHSAACVSSDCDDVDQCGVCLEDLFGAPSVVLSCGHTFHAECISKICISDMDAKLQHEVST